MSTASRAVFLPLAHFRGMYQLLFVKPSIVLRPIYPELRNDLISTHRKSGNLTRGGIVCFKTTHGLFVLENFSSRFFPDVRLFPAFLYAITISPSLVLFRNKNVCLFVVLAPSFIGSTRPSIDQQTECYCGNGKQIPTHSVLGRLSKMDTINIKGNISWWSWFISFSWQAEHSGHALFLECSLILPSFDKRSSVSHLADLTQKSSEKSIELYKLARFLFQIANEINELGRWLLKTSAKCNRFSEQNGDYFLFSFSSLKCVCNARYQISTAYGNSPPFSLYRNVFGRSNWCITSQKEKDVKKEPPFFVHKSDNELSLGY